MRAMSAASVRVLHCRWLFAFALGFNADSQTENYTHQRCKVSRKCGGLSSFIEGTKLIYIKQRIFSTVNALIIEHRRELSTDLYMKLFKMSPYFNYSCETYAGFSTSTLKLLSSVNWMNSLTSLCNDMHWRQWSELPTLNWQFFLPFISRI